MENKYKYIHFVKVGDTGKTSTWLCCTNKNNDGLGVVKWYPGWRQYCFFPKMGTVFSGGCLKDIDEFIHTQMDKRRVPCQNGES